MVKLKEQDRLALSRIYAETTPFGAAVRAGLDTAEVLDRVYTGVGVYVTIRFAAPLPDDDPKFTDWEFDHPSLAYGGSFMCWRMSAATLLIEGVT